MKSICGRVSAIMTWTKDTNRHNTDQNVNQHTHKSTARHCNNFWWEFLLRYTHRNLLHRPFYFDNKKLKITWEEAGLVAMRPSSLHIHYIWTFFIYLLLDSIMMSESYHSKCMTVCKITIFLYQRYWTLGNNHTALVLYKLQFFLLNTKHFITVFCQEKLRILHHVSTVETKIKCSTLKTFPLSSQFMFRSFFPLC